MTNRLFPVGWMLALGLAVPAANAQRAVPEGVLSYTVGSKGVEFGAKAYFTGEATATTMVIGPATVTVLKNESANFQATLFDVPVGAVKAAGIATPDEIEKLKSAVPVLSFKNTQQTKRISGFDCQLITATDAATGGVYEVWITHDVTVPEVAIPVAYRAAGGFPVRYELLDKTRTGTVTVVSVTNEKVPPDIFDIPDGFDKMTLDELNAMAAGAR